jgi:putative membrane protein
VPYRALLLLIFLALLAIGCINPLSPQDLVLEHSLTLLTLGLIVALGWRRPLSNPAYTGLFLFLALHVLGAHYTYSLVPYDRWAAAITGRTLTDLFGWQRNHFDRLVHFSFGLLVYPAALEMLERRTSVRGAWAIALTAALLNSLSTGYELLEWLLTMVVAPEQAELYNGQQGDVWDAHKDVGMATLGAVLAAVGMGLWRMRRPTKPGRRKPD